MVATILVVDDSQTSRQQIREILEQADLGIRILEAEDGADALPMALSGEVDIVISDIVMPRLDGIALLRSIRRQLDATTLPVILLTAQDSSDAREQSFESGTNDYLTQPFSSMELVGRVQVQLRLKRMELELRRSDERQRRLGAHDELTGLANRRHILDLCRRELARSRRHRFAMSVAIMHIDRFRVINRRVGDLIGDVIISETGALLQRQLRTPDVLGRLGGAKFAALLPQTDAPQSALVCERLVVAVQEHAFPNNDVGDVTMAVGLSTYPGAHLESVDELYSAAESSLDQAKALGGNRVQVWDDQQKK